MESRLSFLLGLVEQRLFRMNLLASSSYDLFVAPLPISALSNSSPCGIGVGHLDGEGRGEPGLVGALAEAVRGGGDLGGDLGTEGAHIVGETINGSCGLI